MTTVKHILDQKGHDVHCIHPDASVFDALKMMAKNNIGSLVVLENGKLVGLVTERHYADRSEVLRIGIWNDLTLVADGRQKRLDELGHARGFRTRQLDNAVLRLRSRDIGQSGGHIVRRDRLDLEGDI
jgi:CBS domain-containing protein